MQKRYIEKQCYITWHCDKWIILWGNSALMVEKLINTLLTQIYFKPKGVHSLFSISEYLVGMGKRHSYMCAFHFYRDSILGLTLVLKCVFSPFWEYQRDSLFCTLHVYQRRTIPYIIILIGLESKILTRGYFVIKCRYLFSPCKAIYLR